MKRTFTLWLSLTLSVGIFNSDIQAQVINSETQAPADTVKQRRKYESPPTGLTQKQPFYHSKIFRATIVPAVLITYGLTTIKDNGIYSSYAVQRDLHREFPDFHTTVDDYLIYAPFVELGMAYALQVKGNHDFLNTGLLILKAEALNAALVFGLKSVTKQERPDGSNSYSLPSGHTAHAFLAASILHSELRHRSQWYGVGAYAIATSVGALRMLNNKHWQSDVLTGAGIGILSSHMAYLSHRNRWGNKPTVSMHPTYIFRVPGVGLALDLDQFKNRKLRRPAKLQPEAVAALN